MEIYNTLKNKKESFKPREDNKVQMFVCGPTVYDHIHIGNARTFVFFDVVAKYLKYKYGNENVTYIQNITDIDNKIIERAEKEGVDPIEYAQKYSEIFKQDMQALGVTSPEYKNATDHIPEVIKQVQTLLDKGNAYLIEGDGIYFDLATFPEYGKLSGRTASMADDAVSRIDDSDKKRNKGDFAIWKFKQHNDPSWPAPFGEGRPGWHIEDTAITEKYFGSQYDIHGGGQDLIFPHHEAEIAQQESASGLKPFVKYWMHGGFLVNKEAKMSKSAGNFETAHELLKKHPKEALRFYLLSNNYRSPLDYSEESIKTAEAAVYRINEFRNRLLWFHSKKEADDSLIKITDEAMQEIESALDGDFDTPKAFAAFFDFIRNINPYLENIPANLMEKIIKIINLFDVQLGVVLPPQELPKEVVALKEEYEKAKENKDFTNSDKLREEIKILGYKVEDTAYGPLISSL